MSRAAGWRDRAAVDLVLKHLPSLEAEGPALVMEDPLPDLARALGPALGLPTGRGADTWHRRAFGGRPASPWPRPPVGGPDPAWGSAFLRLSKAKDELEMAAHAAAHRLAPGGRLFVYGAKDEGAGSAASRLEPLFGEVRSLATGGRCRLLEAVRPELVTGLRAGLLAWRIETEPPHPDVTADRWVSYPGVFSAGRLDQGTALLLDALPIVPAAARVLDFGCGDGAVAGALAGRAPGLRPLMLDVDAVALEAAAENVPAGVTVLGDGWDAFLQDPSVGGHEGVTTAPAGEAPAETVGSLDAVVSNPPYHRGKAESLGVVQDLIRGAAVRLRPGGSLTMVVQRRLPVEPLLSGAFRSVEAVAEGGPFRVWRGTGPVKTV